MMLMAYKLQACQARVLGGLDARHGFDRNSLISSAATYHQYGEDADDAATYH